MNNYIKKTQANNIVFKDITNNTKLVVVHNDNEHIFDTIFIDDKLDITFIEYIIKELKNSNDLGVIFSLYDSIDLENLMFKYGLRVSNYQYLVEYKDCLNINNYDISNNLDDESKKYYLHTVNKLSMNNRKYFNSKLKSFKFNETWFNNEEYIYRIYRKNGKIVGIVDYKVFDDNSNYVKPTNEVTNYNNKLCIRGIFGKDKIVLEDILKDLLNTYKKDIIVSITYTENNLKYVVKKMDGKFNYCEYVLSNVLIN